MPPVVLYQSVLPVSPGERRSVVAGLRGISVEDFREAVRSGIGGRGDGRRDQHRNSREAEDRERQAKNGEHRHLHLLRLDFLAEIFWRAPDHQPGDKDSDDDEQEHAVEAGADAAEDDLAELDQQHRNQTAERRKAVMHGIDGTIGGRRRRHRPQT